MSNVLRLAIVDPNDSSRTQLKNMLLGMDVVWLEAECSRYEFFSDVIAQTKPDIGVIAIDSNPEKGLKLLEQVREIAPDCALLVVSSSTDGQIILRAMRGGAREFLTQPIKVEDLVGALDRISAAKFGTGDGRGRTCHVIAVCGATGGVGTTSLAVNLGCALAQEERNSVVLVDLDMALGDADVFLDTIPDYTLVDVAQNIARLDFTLLKRSLTKHASGLYLLPRPVQLQDTSHVTPDDLTRVLGLLKASFTHMILDLSKSFSALDAVALKSAKDILLVTQLDLPAECGAADDVLQRGRGAQGQGPRGRQPRGAGKRRDQPEEGPGNDGPRDLLAVAERLQDDGRSAEQRRPAGRAGAAGRHHAGDPRLGKQSHRPVAAHRDGRRRPGQQG
jgi:pilus assembly protein CpaE